jgi:formamidopyrimidine-DNA glycosylase
MPELPEVESVCAHLRRLLLDRSIIAAEVSRPRLVQPLTPDEFCQGVCEARFLSVGRRGKHILLNLDNGRTIIVHLRMDGRFLYVAADAPLPKFVHAKFHLDGGKTLAFHDQRHFAIMRLVETARLTEAKELRDLAPEPLEGDFTPHYLAAALARSRRSLKETLLDQKIVLGLGNIYAAEAMFAARLNPEMPANAVSRTKIPALHRVIRAILAAAIEAGTTIDANPESVDGKYFGASFEEALAVYGREGEPCLRCATPIARIKQGQRSTYFCPKCQKSPPLAEKKPIPAGKTATRPG